MFTKNKIIGFTFFILFLVMLAAGYRRVDDSIVATVAQQTISVSEFKARMMLRSGGMTQHFNSEENKKQLLNEMIDHEVQVNVAKQAGYDKDPEVIAALERIMISKLRSTQLEKILQEVTVGQGEVEAYYKENIAKYTTPARSRVAIIHFKLPATASEQKQAEVKARADEVYLLAKTLPESFKGFGSLAAKYSEDQASRYSGGDIGWLQVEKEHGQLDASLFQAIKAFNNKNDLAPVIKGDDGYYLAKLIEKQSVRQQPLAKVEQSIHQILMRQKRLQAEADWLALLKNRVTPVIIHQDVLQSIQPPASIKPGKQGQQPPALPNG